MAITEDFTCRDICTDALRKIRVVAMDEPATDDQIDIARRGLSRLLKAWQNKGYNLFTVQNLSTPVLAVNAHPLTDRAVEINSIRFKRGDIETPMQRLDREEWDGLPKKTSTGIPTTFYYDKQKDTGTIYVWPILNAPASETLEITYVREVNDVDLNETIDVPSEFWDAVVYGLAARLADDFGRDVPRVVARAEEELRLALEYEHVGSVYFTGDN